MNETSKIAANAASTPKVETHDENTTKSELRRMLIDYRDELAALAARELYEDDDGEFVRVSDWREDREPLSAFDYFERRGIGDIRFEVDLHMECTGGRILVAFGGPNIWIHAREIHGYWATDHDVVHLDERTSEVVEDYIAELWEMKKVV